MIDVLFRGAEREQATAILLEECTRQLPLTPPDGYERIHLAVLKISKKSYRS